MAQAKKPSIELRDKENINPSLVRKNEAVDSDFHNIYEVLFDHAQKIDGFTGGNTGNKFYGFHSSLEILAGAYPDAEEDSFAIIEGVTPQIAQVKNGEWVNTGGRAAFVFLDNKFKRPDPGTVGTWYIVKDSNTASLWYAGKYHDFVMPDLSNYYTKEEINEDFTKNGGNKTDTGESLRLAINANETDISDLQDEVNSIEIPEIVDALNSTFVDKTLSANQGRVLKGYINDINVFLNGDDVDLDQIKEISDYIKQNADDLENLTISNIADLPSALAGKEDKFSKNTAFNKNFGTGQNDVMPGNFVLAADKTKWNNKETPSGAQIKADAAEQNAKDYADTLDNNRTVVKKANTATYPSVVDDFSKNLLEFTANAGEVIEVIVDKGLVTSGGLQAISTGNNQLKPVGGTDVTLIFPDGSGDKTIPKGMLSILATGTPNVYKIDGSLESLESGGSNITNLNEIATRNYSDLQGIPTTFPPSAHGHQWFEINSKPSSYPPSVHSHNWYEIGNKPSGYNPLPHNHEWSEINNKPGFFSGFYIATGAAAGSRAYIQNGGTTLFIAGTNMSIVRDGDNFIFNATGGGGTTVTNLNQIETRNYSDLQNKPSAFPPTTHSHTLAQIPKVVVDVTINQSNGNLIVHYSNGTSAERSFGTINANKFTE